MPRNPADTIRIELQFALFLMPISNLGRMKVVQGWLDDVHPGAVIDTDEWMEEGRVLKYVALARTKNIN